MFTFGLGFGLGLTVGWMVFAVIHMDHDARVFLPFVRAA